MSRNDAVTVGKRPARVPARVRTIKHAWIPMPDGTRLAARIWLPVPPSLPGGGGTVQAGGPQLRLPAAATSPAHQAACLLI